MAAITAIFIPEFFIVLLLGSLNQHGCALFRNVHVDRHCPASKASSVWAPEATLTGNDLRRTRRNNGRKSSGIPYQLAKHRGFGPDGMVGQWGQPDEFPQSYLERTNTGMPSINTTPTSLLL